MQVIEHAHVTLWAINRDRRIVLLEGNLIWDNEGKDTTNDAIGHNIYNVFGWIWGQDNVICWKNPIERILQKEASNETVEMHMNGSSRWHWTCLVPLVSTLRSDNTNRQPFVGGVIGESIHVTGMHGALRKWKCLADTVANSCASVIRNLRIRRRRIQDCWLMLLLRKKLVGWRANS